MPKLADVLLKQNLATAPQLQQAEEAHRKSGANLALTLVELGVLTEQRFVDSMGQLSRHPSAEYTNLGSGAELAKLVPEAMAKKIHCVPLRLSGPYLHVAMCNPIDEDSLEQLAFRSGKMIKPFVAGPVRIVEAWKNVYGAKAVPAKSADAGLDQALSGAIDEVKVLEPGKEEEKGPIGLQVGVDDAPIIKVVNGMLLKAISLKASDIHIEPSEEGLRVRYRIDGVLHKQMDLPAGTKTSIISRIKIMASLNIAEKRLPQDGRIKIQLGDGSSVDFRVSTLPGIYGEKIVIRILGQGGLKKSVDEIGFRERSLDYVREALRNPYGMILVTGPTGSGKTTTLYTMLSQLNQDDVNIVTAEDPVEYNLAGTHQVNVKPDIGFTFDMALRSFLRQDPDIILVGEMRDYETASIAIKAALTGHLVLSTLHTNDSPSTIVRLIDMGIEPYLVASAVKLVIAQRLVRKLCPACKEEVSLSDADRSNLRETVVSSIERLYQGKGCPECANIGYKGRIPVFEVLTIRSKEMKRVITEGGSEVQVAQVARREGMQSLREDVLRLVNEGTTSLEEAYSILLAE